MLQRLRFLCSLALYAGIGTSSFAEQAKTDVSSDMLVGVWCGEAQEFAYSWRHIMRPDGTFSTYFEDLPNSPVKSEPLWVHGSWMYQNGMVMQFSTSQNYVGGEEFFDGLPLTDFYETRTLTSDTYTTYYADWDTVFVSTRCPDAMTS